MVEPERVETIDVSYVISLGGSSSSGRGRKTGNRYWCNRCGRAMAYIKDANAYMCMEDGETIYLDNPNTSQKRNEHGSGISSVDGLSDDKKTQHSNEVTKFRHIDVRSRSRFATSQAPQIDPELKGILEHNRAYLVDYHEIIPQSDDEVVSSKELKEREQRR
jgi:hypothetical protein